MVSRSSGSSDKQKIQVTNYYMSIWYALGVGPLDSIFKIFIDDKLAWEGGISEPAAMKIDDRDLFGGIKEQGGIYGSITYLDGNDEQKLPEYLAAKFGLTPNTCPAHRGIASLFFSGAASPAPGGAYGNGKDNVVYRESEYARGLNHLFDNRDVSSHEGFYWHSNVPSIPPVKVKARRIPKGLSRATSKIEGDVNVIHVIYEVLVSGSSWSPSSVDPEEIDTAAFEAAAQIVYDEGIVISMLWNARQTGEQFIDHLREYVDAVTFTDPSTGLLSIKLIRDDYDPNTLFEVTPDNTTISNVQRKLWGETVNELVVTWTNPVNEKEETVTVQDLGNMAVQGQPVSDELRIPGIRSANLAMKIGSRVLRNKAAPLMSCRAKVDRSASHLTLGDVVKLTWPEDGIDGAPMRIVEIDYGDSRDPAITLYLLEDIFAINKGDYYDQPETAWVSGEIDPKILDHSQVTTLPYYMVQNMGGGIGTLEKPDVAVALLAADADRDVRSYVVVFEDIRPNGNTIWRGSEARSILSRATLDGALAYSGTTSSVALSGLSQGFGVEAGFFALIGYGDADQEICVVSGIGVTSVTLRRGMLDTVPKAWPSGTPIWFFSTEADIVDSLLRVGDETVTYRFLGQTSGGTLPVTDAPDVTATLTLRPWLPLRPANCEVNGVASGSVSAPSATSLSLSWSNRNRLNEDSLLLNWTASTVTPEVGVTTTITILDLDGTTVIDQVNGLSGTTYTLDTALFGIATSAKIKFTAKNADGDESLQGHIITVNL